VIGHLRPSEVPVDLPIGDGSKVDCDRETGRVECLRRLHVIMIET